MGPNLFRISSGKLSIDEFCKDPDNSDNANCIEFITEPESQSQKKEIENTVILVILSLVLLLIFAFIFKKVCGWIKVNSMTTQA